MFYKRVRFFYFNPVLLVYEKISNEDKLLIWYVKKGIQIITYIIQIITYINCIILKRFIRKKNMLTFFNDNEMGG